MDAQGSLVRRRSNSTDGDQGPPPQRQRRQTGTAGFEIAQPTIKIIAVKDEKYYRPDGDCIIQVENILFKIHRYHLSEDSDSSVFRNLFSLPTGAAPSEGQQDCNPIVLSGDTPAQFRAFLSFSYSTPRQLQINRMSADDLERLTNIIQFAHKYLLQNCLRWALESVEHVLEHSVATIPEGQYPLILRAMALCTPVHTEICEHICKLLKPRWITHIKADIHRLGPAFDIVETFRMESFLVDLYLVALDGLATCEEPARALTVEGPLYGISTIHQLRVLAGYWYLSRSFGNFLSAPPTNIHSGVCTPKCDRIVTSLWKTCRNHAGDTNVHSPSDVFQKLGKFKDDFVARIHAIPSLPCPIEADMDAALAAFKSNFKTSFTNQFFALPHGPQ
ncbi:hypothetical protein DFH08DRAFT_156949 [Mycena albidolilacea]|uniref:BTB domain-containing protein n=1 Tax=Mycena albidolilacea TaxID=1033008 RepID=A0AAD7A2D5_9AGAR|nr:hypothetical protein DFH08DRAFT_156949 [Mycena albidolilacea]